MKKKILILNMSKGFGGGEVHTSNLINGLIYKHTIFFLGKKNGEIKQYINNNLPKVITIDSISHLIRVVFENKDIILHAQDGRSAHIAMILAFIFKRKYIITRHVNFPLKNTLSKLSYIKANALICISKQVYQNLEHYNKSIYLIYPGITKPKQDLDFEKIFFGKKRTFSVCHIGNFQAVKNFELTISLAKECLKNKLDIHFFLVGDGDLKTKLLEDAKGLPNITFTGKTNNIGSILKNCDVQIIPSINEGLSLVLLEGYTYLVPAIANNIGGMKELIIHQHTGFLIEKNIRDVYFKYLKDMYLNKNLLKNFRENIKKFNEQHDFSVEKMIEQHINLYEKI